MKLDKQRERGRGDMRLSIALLAPESESDQRPHSAPAPVRTSHENG